MASIVANMDQPDFSDSFIGWLQTVHKFPRAFDFKYESLVSILDDLGSGGSMLFAKSSHLERKICSRFTRTKCKFGFSLDEFELKWKRKLAALKFATTIYLREPNGLTQTRLFIEKGEAECRFNILNYLSPYWREITQSGEEFHVTFNLNKDEGEEGEEEGRKGMFLFRKNDEIFFMKREEFWMAKRKGDSYTYKSAKLLKEPFKSLSGGLNLINIFGLVLNYNEKDSTLSVVDMGKVLKRYKDATGCGFKVNDLTKDRRY